MSHGKLICKVCKAVIVQCRCPDHGNNVTESHGPCESCKAKTESEPTWPNNQLPKVGTKVRTHLDVCGKLEMKRAESFFVKEQHLKARRPYAIGTYEGWVPGCGGDVWWVKHENGDTAAYAFDELDFVIR